MNIDKNKIFAVIMAGGKGERLWPLSSQLYDFDDSKVRLGGEVRVTDNLSVYGESMDLKGNKSDTYVGVRSYF